MRARMRRSRASPFFSLAALFALAGCLGFTLDPVVFTVANSTDATVAGAGTLTRADGDVVGEASFTLAAQESVDLGTFTRRTGDYAFRVQLDDGREARANVTVGGDVTGVGFVVTANEILVRRSRG